MENKVQRCAIYIRVSSAEQVMHGKSLEAQLAFLTDYAIKRGWKVVGHFADEGKTARKELKRRKAIKALLDEVRHDNVDIILFWKMDRWFRNVADFYKVQDILDAHGCKWVAAAEPSMNLETREGRLNVNIMLSINQNETDTTSERIKFVNEASVRQGKAIFGNSSVPLGYKVELVNGVKSIVKDPENEHLVSEIFSYYLLHQSKSGTVKYINEKYGPTITMNVIHTICRNTWYYGSYRGNDHYCPAYITREQYTQIQEINQRNIKVYQSQSKRDTFLFSGLMKCPLCGRRLSSARRIRANGTIYSYYRCVNHYSNKTCSYGRVINERVAEEYLLHNISKLLEKKEINQEKVNDKTYKTVLVDLNKYRKELDRLNNMYQKGRIDDERYDTEYMRLSDIINKNENQVTLQPAIQKSYERIHSVLSGDWLSVYENLNSENKRAFWRGIIRSMDCSPERGVITDVHFFV